MNRLFISIAILTLVSCATPPPKNKSNVCSIFAQYPQWHRAAKKAEQKYGTPVPVLMSFIYQESSFNSEARPPRKKIFFIIPSWKRISSAYGYAQALNGTWKEYRNQVNRKADRNNFHDAIDFMSWYCLQAKKKIGMSQFDSFNLYIAYVEGIGGYIRKTYRNKKWLIDAAHKVQARTWLYRQQLNQCASSLHRGKAWYKF